MNDREHIFAKYDPKTNKWTLLKDFYCHGIYIEKGFSFSASIPRIFWCIISPEELSLEAACVHDYIYKHIDKTYKWFLYGVKMNRKIADKVFRNIAIEYGAHKWKAKTAYIFVRVFGYFIWKKRKKAL